MVNLALQRTPATGYVFSSPKLTGPWPGPLSLVVRRLSPVRPTRAHQHPTPPGRARHPSGSAAPTADQAEVHPSWHDACRARRRAGARAVAPRGEVATGWQRPCGASGPARPGRRHDASGRGLAQREGERPLRGRLALAHGGHHARCQLGRLGVYRGHRPVRRFCAPALRWVGRRLTSRCSGPRTAAALSLLPCRCSAVRVRSAWALLPFRLSGSGRSPGGRGLVRETPVPRGRPTGVSPASPRPPGQEPNNLKVNRHTHTRHHA